MAMPLTVAQSQTKRFDTDFYVEGFATTFDQPYVMWEFEDGSKVYETIYRGALEGADLSDVIMQYDHAGMVFARNKMGQGKPPSLLVEPQQRGLFIAADLGVIEEAKAMFAAISGGLIYRMSWAFTVAEEAYNKDTRTRTIQKIKKVYDVSAVSYPANGETDISARSFADGVIGVERREALARRLHLLRIKTKLEV